MNLYSFNVFQLDQGNRTSCNRIKETEEAVPYSQETEPNSEIDSSGSSCFHPNNNQITSQNTDTTSLNSSAQASEYEDAESGRFVVFMPKFLF